MFNSKIVAAKILQINFRETKEFNKIKQQL